MNLAFTKVPSLHIIVGFVLCVISHNAIAVDFSMGYQYDESKSAFGLPVDTQMSVQSFQLTAVTESFQFDWVVPRTKVKGPAVFFGVVPLRDFIRLPPDRRRQFLDALNITSLQDIANAETEGTSDMSISGTYFAYDEFLDDYRLYFSLDIKWDNGDARRLLGTGSKDTSLRMDWEYGYDGIIPEFSIGHVWVGESDRLPAQNFSFYQAGVNYNWAEWLSLGVRYYQGMLKTDTDIKQIESSLSFNFDNDFSINVSQTNGKSETALDNAWSVGLYYQF